MSKEWRCLWGNLPWALSTPVCAGNYKNARPELPLPGPLLRAGQQQAILRVRWCLPGTKNCVLLAVKVVNLQVWCFSPVMQATACVDNYLDPPVSSLWDWEDPRNWHTHEALATTLVIMKSFVSDLGISSLLPAPWNSNKVACYLISRSFTISDCTLPWVSNLRLEEGIWIF